MNIIVFGANGRSGLELVQQALQKGDFVTAFVREPAKLRLQHDRLTIEKGEVTSYSDVERVLNKQPFDAVFHALGAKSVLSSDAQLIDALKNIIKAMETTKQKQLIHISFIGAREESTILNASYRIVIPLFMKALLRDHRKKEQLIKNSSLQWIIVQPPVLTNEAFNGKYNYEISISYNRKRRLKLSRANLAHFMLSLLEHSSYNQEAIFVTE